MRWAWLLVPMSCTALAAACGDDMTSSPPRGGAPGSPGEDAGASPPPSASDAAPGDAAPPADASGTDDASAGRDLSTDRTKFFGASRCAAANVRLCEDFESGTLDTQTWKVTGVAPTIDASEHARGQRSLHFKKTGSGASYVKETKTFPAKNDTYFGRVFVRFASLPTPPGMTYAHWTILAASGTGTPGEIRVGGQLQNGKNLFGVGTDNRTATGTGDWTTSDADPKGAVRAVPTSEWMCIEWMHDGAASETRFFWDATEHPSLHTTKTVHGGNTNDFVLPQFTNVWLGWDEYQDNTETFELWIDEIAIDDARIGCVL